MIYIIGVDHNVQTKERGDPETGRKLIFADCLRKVIREVHLDFIAEEWRQELLDREGEVSIAKEIASENGIIHRFCDPTYAERAHLKVEDLHSINKVIREKDGDRTPEWEIEKKANAILIGRYFPVREQFWLDRIREFGNMDGLLVCGDGHVDTFGRLLSGHQIGSTVLARAIGFVEGQAAANREDIRYLEQHPELAKWEMDSPT
jgi:hypothetical protein